MPTAHRRNPIAACIAAFITAGIPASAQPQITSLGVLPNMSSSEAHDVSADGTVVVGSCTGAGGTRAFRWTATGMRGLPRLTGGVDAECNAISQDGLFAVGSSTSSLGNHAVRWPSPGGVEDLGTLEYSGNSEARAVSADGAVVVGSASLNSPSRAFRWT